MMMMMAVVITMRMMMVAVVITMRMMMMISARGDKRMLDLSEVSFQGLVNHKDIVVENDWLERRDYRWWDLLMIKKFSHLSRCSTPASLTSCSSFLIGLSLYLRKFLRMTKWCWWNGELASKFFCQRSWWGVVTAKDSWWRSKPASPWETSGEVVASSERYYSSCGLSYKNRLSLS